VINTTGDRICCGHHHTFQHTVPNIPN
jgi:hypothetical protein